MRKIRIVVLGTRGIPDIQGGIEMHCQNLYPILVILGCEVIILARSPYTCRSIHEYKGVTIIPIPAIRQKYLEAFLHTFIGIFYALRHKPDILHIHAIGPSFFIPLARLLGMKVVFTTHGPDYNHLKWKKPARVFLKLCERIGVMTANKVIGVSQAICRDIGNKYRKKAVYIPNGISRIEISEDTSLLNKNRLESGKYILSVGRLVPSKGFGDLIDAFLSLPEESIRGWKLVIVGGADHTDAYSKSIETKAANNPRIVLTGALVSEMLGNFYTYAGLFVLASHYEGLPLVLLEAMGFGLSCIASDIPGNREVGLPDERYFPVGNISDLSDKILNWIDNPLSESEKIKEITSIKMKYNWEKLAIRIRSVYEAVR